jgi:sugar phosphate isomerase/epimerase
VTGRRDFLRRAGAALAAGAVTPQLLRALDASAPAERIKRIGLQLYTVRDEMEKDVDRTLARVAKIGYKEVEFAGYFARTPQQIRKALDANGLTAPSSHIDIATVRAADWPRTLEGARTMGMEYLIVASLDDDDRVSQQSYRAAADTLISASRSAAAAGITLGYHNHNYEFEPLGGKTGLEVMLERTTGSGVVFEMDIYWITSAGQDPLAWFAKWPGRFPLVHVKDAGPAPKYVMHDVGAGVIDWKHIFKMSKQAGIKHYFVEHDEPGDAFKSAAASYAYLKKLEF